MQFCLPCHKRMTRSTIADHVVSWLFNRLEVDALFTGCGLLCSCCIVVLPIPLGNATPSPLVAN